MNNLTFANLDKISKQLHREHESKKYNYFIDYEYNFMENYRFNIDIFTEQE